MAENHYPHVNGKDAAVSGRNFLGCFGKKEEGGDDHQKHGAPASESKVVLVSEFNQVGIEEGQKVDGYPHSLKEKLQRSHSSTSSSSDEEEAHSEEKKKKEKKGLKEKIKEKINGEEEKPQYVGESMVITDDKKGDVVQVEENHGLIEKIKEKLPGTHPAPAPAVAPLPAGLKPADAVVHCEAESLEGAGAPAKEKKGILEKIKEKLPGYNPKNEAEETSNK